MITERFHNERLAANQRCLAGTNGGIEVHIEELVLDGFAAGSRHEIAEAIERELRELLLQKGLPTAWQHNGEKIQAGPIRATATTRAADAGAEIARAIHKGGTR